MNIRLLRRQVIFLSIISSVLFCSCSKYITETGKASYYGKNDGYNGRKTADGEVFNSKDFTAAHKTLPFNSIVYVKNLSNGKTVQVRINDRGPYAKGRVIDLSFAAAQKIGLVNEGVTEVELKYKRRRHG
ncbi:MAG TPA: septal ring lytic transglycosylase RlpA family protein [Ferruginibacter sp.]|nr:septal ring lytic transglycosylase RlpA family protein [Ferruginibacter sp.]